MKFEVTTEEAELIMVALGHMSFNKVAGLIVKLQFQSNHQEFPENAPGKLDQAPKQIMSQAEATELIKVKKSGRKGSRKINLSLGSKVGTLDSMDRNKSAA